MPAGPARTIQADFSAGMYRSVARDLIPSSGVYDIRNGLLDEGGAIYRRGGSTYRSTAGFGTFLPLVWDGLLEAGRRILIASQASFGRLNGDGTVTNLGGAGVARPVRPVVKDGTLYLPGGVTYDGAALGVAPKVGPFYAVVANRLLVGNGDRIDFSVLQHIGTGSTTSGNNTITGVKTTSGQFQIGQQIVGTGIPAGATISGVGAGTLTISVNADATNTGIELRATGGDPRFDATDFHKLPGGVDIVGIEGLRDSAVVFTTDGVWLIRNLAYNLTDDAGNVQQSLDRYSNDLVLWGDAGIAGWEGGLVVPALDGVWLLTVGATSEAPVPFARISDPIAGLYRDYVRRGCWPGQATVFQSHYLLPILDDSGVVDELVCNLAGRPSARGGTLRPWSRLDGYGGRVAAFAIHQEGDDRQLIGGAGGRVLDLHYFEPRADYAGDADGSAYLWEVTTRDFATGSFNENTVTKLRVGYELAGVDPDLPTIYADYLAGQALPGSIEWGAFEWGGADWSSAAFSERLDGLAPEDEFGVEPFSWRPRKRTRFARFRLGCTFATARLTLRRIEIFVRQSGRV